MYDSFYCNGIGGYGYNPWFSNFYCGMSSLNSLFNSFRGNSRGNCSCNCQSNSNSSSRCSGSSGSTNMGHLLSGNSSSSLGLDDGLGGLPMPGSNVPAYKPCENLNSNIQIMPRPEVPIYSCEDADPRYSGILSGDVSLLGGTVPVASPGLSNLLRPDIGCMDPCTLAGLLMGRIAPAQAQQAAQAPNAGSPSSANSTVVASNNGVTIGADVEQKIQQVAQAVNCDPNDLKGVIFEESSFKTVPDNWNGKSAVGLIQWTQTTVDDLNKNCGYTDLTKEKISQMSVIEQLDLAEATLKRAKTIAGFRPDYRLTPGELYAIVYAPANASKETVSHSGDGMYENNTGLDIDGDGNITRAELAQRTRDGSRFVATG